MSFLGELKRRRVERMAALYAVCAWVLVQVATVAVAGFNLPDWTLRLVVGLVIVGFPFALVLAWMFDFTRDGLRRANENGPVPSERAGRWIPYTLIIVLLLVGVVARVRMREPDDRTAASSIAVLPFATLGEPPENEAFSNGITEEIMNALARVNGLRVASSTSAFELKKQNLSPSEIAARLQVANVLEGSVRRNGDRVRITAQLIDARTDRQRWSRSYDRDLKEILAVESEIARAIASELKLSLRTR